MPKEKKETKVRKGKKKRKKRRSSERWKKYRIEGNKVIREAKSCPRCGPGIFLAKHKDRLFCGKCHYTEYTK
ncbi:MAG: 30S ribosomal protein S27ae [Candidatus Pacearchaeota archaeon]